MVNDPLGLIISLGNQEQLCLEQPGFRVPLIKHIQSLNNLKRVAYPCVYVDMFGPESYIATHEAQGQVPFLPAFYPEPFIWHPSRCHYRNLQLLMRALKCEPAEISSFMQPVFFHKEHKPVHITKKIHRSKFIFFYP